jgi:5-methylcytosine-specific restriction enzyme A
MLTLQNFSPLLAMNRPRGRKWMQLRASILGREPFCRTCKATGKLHKATEVDHINPLHLGGNAWDRNNLQPLCNSCHMDKTRTDAGWKQKPAIGVDGHPVGEW